MSQKIDQFMYFILICIALFFLGDLVNPALEENILRDQIFWGGIILASVCHLCENSGGD